jgi:hypothetical protein
MRFLGNTQGEFKASGQRHLQENTQQVFAQRPAEKSSRNPNENIVFDLWMPCLAVKSLWLMMTDTTRKFPVEDQLRLLSSRDLELGNLLFSSTLMMFGGKCTDREDVEQLSMRGS